MVLIGAPLWGAPVKIVTVIEDFASIARSVGGRHVEVNTLIKGARDLHAVNPKPSMVMKLRKADMIMRLGMKQDSWVDGIIHVARNSKLFNGEIGYMDCSVGISKLEVPTQNIDGRMGDVHIQGNPHYWLSPINGKKIAIELRDRLMTMDPQNKQSYIDNTETFIALLDVSYTRWKKTLEPLASYRFITYHKVWPYFFEAFNLVSLGELEPLPGIAPTTKHILKLKDTVEDSNAQVIVLSASYFSQHQGEKFAKLLDSKFVHVPSNVGEKETPSLVSLCVSRLSLFMSGVRAAQFHKA